MFRCQIAALKQRMATLQREVLPKPQASRRLPSTTPADDGWAELRARMNAMDEYLDQRSLELYRKHPDLLSADLEEEQKKNAFLRERGIKRLDDRVARIAKRLAGDLKE
jgi:hypothetical protein